MTPYYEHAGITIFHGDCRDVIEQYEGQHGVQAFDLAAPPMSPKNG